MSESEGGFCEDRKVKEESEAEVKEMLASEITDKLTPHSSALNPDTYQPYVILMTGVNGAGKTTTIGKLANKFQSDGKSVILAAGDTFRAAAIEQLTIWGERANVPVITAVAKTATPTEFWMAVISSTACLMSTTTGFPTNVIPASLFGEI